MRVVTGSNQLDGAQTVHHKSVETYMQYIANQFRPNSTSMTRGTTVTLIKGSGGWKKNGEETRGCFRVATIYELSKTAIVDFLLIHFAFFSGRGR